MIVEFLSPGGQSVLHDLTQEGFIVGRQVPGKPNPEVAVQLNDPRLSRRHGRLWRKGEEVWYEDLDSSNGSFLEGKRLLQPTLVPPDGELCLGETRVRVRKPATPTAVADSTMQIHMHGKADDTSLEAFSKEATSVELLGLAKFVHSLLGSAERVPLHDTLKRLVASLPGVWRISLIAWPPEENGEIRFLVEPDQMERVGATAGPVSRSLASMAVERAEALLFSENLELNAKAMESCLLRGILSAVYVPLLGTEGEVFGVLCVDSPVPSLPLDASGFHFIRAVGSLLATALSTEKLRLEARQREVEARQLEARRESLANFLNIASHDLKNPLTVVMGCARVIEHLQDLDKIRHLCGKILSASSRAESLIKTYLEVAEITSQKEIGLDLESIGLHQFVADELEFVGQALSQKSPQLINRVPEEFTVRADPQKLRQVLSNLISNGIKYSRTQPVVEVGAQEVDHEWVLYVRDNGVGISEEDQQKLFQKFLRVGDRSLAPGTGLGLWLSGALVQRHGGRIWVESRLQEGTTFFFSLPRPAEEAVRPVRL